MNVDSGLSVCQPKHEHPLDLNLCATRYISSATLMHVRNPQQNNRNVLWKSLDS
jgi:hypothetical protein